MSEPAEMIAAQEIDPSPPAVPEAFAVRDEASANWVVKKIAEARRYAQHVEAWAALEIRRAQREEQFFLDRYGSQLEAWTRSQLAATGARRRSIHLPAGTVGFRQAPPHLVVQDHGELLAWCRSNLAEALAVEIKAQGVQADTLRRWRQAHAHDTELIEHVRKQVLERHLRATGECPQGTVLQSGEKFFVK